MVYQILRASVQLSSCAGLGHLFTLLFHVPSIPQAREQCGGHVDRSAGTLLYHIATRFRGGQERAAMLVEYVCGGKVTGEVQLTGEGGGGGA